MKENELLKYRVLETLQQAVEKYLNDNLPEKKLEDLHIRLEYSRNEKFGDYSSAFILENKKHLPGKPEDIAEKVIQYLVPNEMFSFVEFTKPGFINFRIEPLYLLNYIHQFLYSDGPQRASVTHSQKINFEFVSANPTGPLNIVSARAAAMGDSICNLLSHIGHDVHREFYVNDYGNQVRLLGFSCLARLRESKGEPIQIQGDEEVLNEEELLKGNYIPSEGYRGEYLINVAKNVYKNHQPEIDNYLEKKDYKNLADKFSRWTVEENLASQKEALKQFGVEFDEFFLESGLHESNKVLAVLDNLERAGDVKEEEGKKLFVSSKYGDDKDRVILRKDGRPTYLLADIAYHKNKMDRGFHKMINIWGPDHHGYIARLKGAMLSLSYPENAFRVLIAQQVNLIEKGEKLKMSKRLGQFQTMTDLLEYLGEHAKDVGRYFFVMRTLDAPLDFDLELAKDDSDKNPVFYLQYAHARICSIFREVGKACGYEEAKKLELTEERSRLIFWLGRFLEETYDAGLSMEPHRLCNYLQNLSKAFTQFYMAKNNRLKDAGEQERKGLAYLCELSRICLSEGLKLLGISSPEKLEKVEG